VASYWWPNRLWPNKIRSVHNIQIEHLWRDLKLGLGAKWKELFQTLEFYDALDHNSDAHIWLLHYLFLNDLNHELQEWAGSWNKHVLIIRGEHSHSPRDLFVFGMVENGVHGLDHLQNNDDEDNLDSYGIDWDAYFDDTLQEHHTQNNQSNHIHNDNPFQTHSPRFMSHVEVKPPPSPFTPDQMALFENHVEQIPFRHATSMESRRLLWTTALVISHKLYNI